VRARLIIAVLLLLGLALAPLSASGQGSELRQSAITVLSDGRVSEDTGTRTAIDYFDPENPGAKPPAVRKVEVIQPRGARIDTSVPPRCHASDAELMAQGADACTEASVVGRGYLRLDTGFSGPGRFVEADITLLNEVDQLIFLSTIRGSGARVVTRAEVSGRTVTTEVPMLPGAPPDGAALDVARTKLASISVERGPRRGSYIRTPSRCPRRGYWLVHHRFTYADGVTQTMASRTPCRSPRR